MRILVEHSGYDLLNIGDVAMLQSCVRRLEQRWPEATIEVVCHAPGKLAEFCPNCLSLGPAWAHRPALGRLSKRIRLGGEQAWKTLVPLLPIRSRGDGGTVVSRSLRAAIGAADVVVAAGGGYLCDPFWWHGLGVLTTLRAAQRRGIPTAMFGQGIGPLTNVWLRGYAGRVLGGLDLLMLREGVGGPAFLRDAGVLAGDELGAAQVHRGSRGTTICVTGDDALLTMGGPVERDESARVVDSIGVNLRISPYAGVGDEVGPDFAGAVWRTARDFGARVVALPVSTFDADADLGAIRRVLGTVPAGQDTEFVEQPLISPADLSEAAGRCRVVLTGSYHAAVFAVGSGVPVVALSASDYYAAKFAGLCELYPGLLQCERLDAPDRRRRIEEALRHAWSIEAGVRHEGIARTAQLVTGAATAFDTFAARVDAARRKKAV